MGGSGGGFSGYGTVSAKAQLLASEAGTQSTQREIEINEFLEALLYDFKRLCKKLKMSLEEKLMA